VKAREATICHGDFHPLNILADKNQTTGVIDWSNAVIAEPAMDVGSAIANMSAVPLLCHGRCALRPTALSAGTEAL